MSGIKEDAGTVQVTEPVTSIVPVEMADALRDRAKRAERSLSAEVRIAIRNHLADAA